jgi:hypothetical protein
MIPDTHETEQAQPGTNAEPCGTASLVPDAHDLYDYALSSLCDRLILIQDHLAAIEGNQADIARHQGIIIRHCSAVKALLERALP